MLQCSAGYLHYCGEQAGLVVTRLHYRVTVLLETEAVETQFRERWGEVNTLPT